MYTDTAPSCGYMRCTYLQVDLHKVNARLQLLMRMTPEQRKKHAVNKEDVHFRGGLIVSVDIIERFHILWGSSDQREAEQSVG